MKKTTIILGALFMMLNLSVYSQGGVVISDNGGATSDPDAVLDLQSTTKGFLLPRLNWPEMFAMGDATHGMMVFNRDENNKMYFKVSGTWDYYIANSENLIGNLLDAQSNSTKNSYYIGEQSGGAFEESAGQTTAVGSYSGRGFGTGVGNTAIGANTGPATGTTNLNHTTTLGYNAKATDNHQVVLGTNAETVIIPNKITIHRQYGPPSESDRGTLYVEIRDSLLYYYDGANWEQLNKPRYQVGDLMFGGVICYLDESGQHGLVTGYHTADKSGGEGWRWSEDTLAGITNARANYVYAGEMNTVLIVAHEATQGFSASAAQQCLMFSSYTYGGSPFEVYGDWYLPSLNELEKMYLHKDIVNAAIAGIENSEPIAKKTWSSTESDNKGFAHYMDMDNGDIGEDPTFITVKSVRPVRRF